MAGNPGKPATPKAEKFPRKAIPLAHFREDDEEAVARKYGSLTTSSELAAFRAISASEERSGFGEKMDAPALLEVLRDQAAAVNRGDLSQVEAMLMNQATALQTLFSRLAERGMGHDQIPGFEANMRMALRAQSQCRATLETLAAIKNPPIVYARQANVTTGPQQVNNGLPSHTREFESDLNRLSGSGDELLPDAGTSSHAGRVNQAMEALGEIHRPENTRRESQGLPECVQGRKAARNA